nr:DUF2339 domain-containing protein [Lysobacter sp. CAU 1642]
MLGLLLGAVVGDGEPLGWIGGALLGALWGQVLGLRRELEALRKSTSRVATPSPSVNSAPPVAAASAPSEAPTRASEAAPAARPAAPVAGAEDPWGGPASELSAARRMNAPGAQPDPATASSEPPAAPAAPAEPGLPERLVALAWGWLREGNVPVKLGMLVLFVGVAGLLRYAAERGVFDLPIELRLAAIAAAGLAGLWFGWVRRERQRIFALSLQGGALGVLLLTVFAAFARYQLIPAGAAFFLVVLLVAASGLLAVRQNALALAVLGSIGGFLAPVLISTGSGNHVALFSYYALLNLAVFGVAWVRPWRILNLVGFGFTFVVGTLWAWRYYRPDFYPTVQPFLVLFFLFYVAIALLYALRSAQPPQRAVDGTLVFGTPLVAAGLQAGLMADRPLALAFAAVLAAALYAALAWWIRGNDRLSSLRYSFAVLAVGFATAAVPLALDADLTAQVWALEGAALVWLGLRAARRSQWWAGLALQVVAGLAWLFSLDALPHDAPDWRNGVFVGGLVLSLALGFVVLQLQRAGRAVLVGWAWFVAMAAVWAIVWLRELIDALPGDAVAPSTVVWVAASCLLAAWLRGRLDWPRVGALAIVFQLLALGLALLGIESSVYEGLGLLAWPLWAALTAAAWTLLARPWQRGLSWAHVLSLAILSLAAGIELAQWVHDGLDASGVWDSLAALLPLVLLFAFALPPRSASAWPLQSRFDEYRWRWLIPAGAALAIAWILSLGSRGAAAPLPFIPLFNPLELAQLAVLALLVRAASLAPGLNRTRALMAGGFAGFVWVSVATLRAVHHVGGVPWNDALARSMLGQTSLTVVWSVLGVIAWIVGSRRGNYPLWLGGAVLMGVVLAKLVLIDRQHMGNMPGIVSFLAVGALLTVVGYLAPSPPRGKDQEAAA